jgi:hypothetical protein
MSSVEASLRRVQERLERERAEGLPPRPPAPDRPVTPVRRTATPADQLTRERKQELWDYLLAEHPDLAQMIRSAKATFGAIELEAVLIQGKPALSYGKLRPFNAIRIEACLPDRKSMPKSTRNQP